MIQIMFYLVHILFRNWYTVRSSMNSQFITLEVTTGDITWHCHGDNISISNSDRPSMEIRTDFVLKWAVFYSCDQIPSQLTWTMLTGNFWQFRLDFGLFESFQQHLNVSNYRLSDQLHYISKSFYSFQLLTILFN